MAAALGCPVDLSAAWVVATADAPGPTSMAILSESPSVTPPEVVISTACGGSPGSGWGNKTRQGSR